MQIYDDVIDGDFHFGARFLRQPAEHEMSLPVPGLVTSAINEVADAFVGQ